MAGGAAPGQGCAELPLRVIELAAQTLQQYAADQGLQSSEAETLGKLAASLQSLAFPFEQVKIGNVATGRSHKRGTQGHSVKASTSQVVFHESEECEPNFPVVGLGSVAMENPGVPDVRGAGSTGGSSGSDFRIRPDSRDTADGQTRTVQFQCTDEQKGEDSADVQIGLIARTQTSRTTHASSPASGAGIGMGCSHTTKLTLAFRLLDVDGNGTLGMQELGHCLRVLGVQPRSVRRFLQRVDASGDGIIAKEEFLRLCEEPEFIDITTVMYQLCASGKKIEPPRYMFMIRQSSTFRLAWDSICAILLLYIAIAVPFNIGFGQDLQLMSLSNFDLTVDLFFLADILLNFRTGFFTKEGFEVLDWNLVATHYLKTWFLLDFFSSLPYEHLQSSMSSNLIGLKLLKSGKVMRAIKIVRMARVYRIAKNVRLWDQVSDAIDSMGVAKYISFTRVFVATVMTCHWLGCFMAWVSDGCVENCDVDPNSKNLQFYSAQYVASLYWAMTTMSTVGYGDITPDSNSQRVYAMVAMIIGGTFYGFVVGHITALMTARGLKARVFRERMEELEAWLDFHQFPKNLRVRIKRYYVRRLNEVAAPDEDVIISKLSPELQSILGELMVCREVRHNPLFLQLPHGVISRMVKLVQQVVSEEGECIVAFNEVGYAMFVVVEGTLRMTSGARGTEKTLENGDSFGEEVFCDIKPRYEYSVCALTPSRLQSIPSEGFAREFSNFPHIMELLRRNYRKIMREGEEREQEIALTASHPVDRQTCLAVDAIGGRIEELRTFLEERFAALDDDMNPFYKQMPNRHAV